MTDATTQSTNEAAVIDAIDAVTSALERALTGLQTLRTLLIQPEPPAEFDPKDPANKFKDGKLTPRGAEICYRLFDAGHTRYAVGALMDISFSAATNRYYSWRDAGGIAREKQPL
ncbi:hypothetical protein [Caballeronia sp. ATUFL_F1_KS4A]|uniref:hypothetical protein n=1 Tax=Caballeronia sp. ATUFL_F1_KS4A TaxID=2921768 RepID=UPI0020283561|nr:hypothetical protein [Caballeronia sp. ATUFL_F1_KS4A]